MDLCTLALRVGEYRDHRVRIKAFMTHSVIRKFASYSPEASVLYDPRCKNGTPLIEYIFKPEVKGKIKLLQSIFVKREYAFVEIEGTIRWPFINLLPSTKIEIDNVLEAREMDDGMPRWILKDK
jgi:hypothetical protein